MHKDEILKTYSDVCESGRQYLISCVDNDIFFDEWYGTDLPPPVKHSSSPMLCFFTALALQKSGGIPDSVREKLLSVLARAQKGESYGYDNMAPADSDDTAFALRTLIILGETVTIEMVDKAMEQFAQIVPQID